MVKVLLFTAKVITHKLYSISIKYIDKALAIDPNYKEALNDKGFALYRLGNHTQAIQYYDKALAVDPNDKAFSKW